MCFFLCLNSFLHILNDDFCGTIIVFGKTRTADLLWWYHSTLVLTLDYFNLLTRCIFTDLINFFFTGFRCYKVTTSKNQSFDWTPDWDIPRKKVSSKTTTNILSLQWLVLILTLHIYIIEFLFISPRLQRLLRPWSYSSWIYNYQCNQCLSPLTLWVQIPLRRGVLDTALCEKVCLWLAADL